MSKLVKSEDEVMLADSARGFLDDAAPVWAFRDLRDSGRAYDPALWKRICDMGWAGALIPEEAGGVNIGHAAAGMLAHEMGRTLAGTPFLSSAIIAATILRRIGGERATSAMAAIATGELTYALAIDEAHKFAPEATMMSAERQGKRFRLSGNKCFVVDGGFADRLLVLARNDTGLILFELPSDCAGITRTAQTMIDSRDAARISFEDVEATGDDVLGQVGDAMTILKPALEAGQAALAAEMSGLAAGAFDMTVGYLKDRKQFGQPIGSFQALQHRAAHLWCEIEVTASAILNAGRVLDADPDQATLAVSLAKARATSTAQLAVMEGVQMHGGIGMTDEYDMGFYMKRARVSAEWLGDYGYHAEQVAALRGI